MTKYSKENIYDNFELVKPFLIAIAVTWVPFSIVEIHNPYVEKKLAYEKACADKGGFVYDRQNEETKCIRKDYIVIGISK